VQGLHLIVSDIMTARNELDRCGIAVSDAFHDTGGIFHHAGSGVLAAGPNPQRKSYASYATFSDPDGNSWVFQEITTRLTGQIENGDDSFTPELTDVVRRAKAAQRTRDGAGEKVSGGLNLNSIMVAAG
jgi:hypothetical protein